MTHTFDFKKKFSNDLKAEIIERRKTKLMTICTEKQALRRAKEEMMPSRKYGMYAFVMQALCDYYDAPTNTDYVDISTNRNGEHSWYLKLSDDKVIRVSDHMSYQRYVNILITPKSIIIINSPYDEDGDCYSELINDIFCTKDDFVFKFHKHVLSIEKEMEDKYRINLQYWFDRDLGQFVSEAIKYLQIEATDDKIESIGSFFSDCEDRLISDIIECSEKLDEQETDVSQVSLMYEKSKQASLFHTHDLGICNIISLITQEYGKIDWDEWKLKQ